MDSNKIVVIDANNNEVEMEIIFTFDNEDYNKSYVVYTDPNDESGESFVSAYHEDGTLEEIVDDAEFEMIQEVFNTFALELEEDAEE